MAKKKEDRMISITSKKLLGLLIPCLEKTWENGDIDFVDLFIPFRAYMLKRYGEYDYFTIMNTDVVIECLKSAQLNYRRFSGMIADLSEYVDTIDGCFKCEDDSQGGIFMTNYSDSEWGEEFFDETNRQDLEDFLTDVLENEKDENYALIVKVLDELM